MRKNYLLFVISGEGRATERRRELRYDPRPTTTTTKSQPTTTTTTTALRRRGKTGE